MPKHDRIALIVLLTVTLIGAVLRCLPVGESLWVDELHTSWTVMASSGQELAQRAQLGNNSTIYFRLVRVVTSLVGNTEWSLRIISIASGTLLIPLTFFVCRFCCRCGIVPALLAAVLVCIDRHNNFYACEARTYALVQFMALGHVGLFILLLTRDGRTWTWLSWTITGMGLFHLHCTTAVFLVAEVVAFAILVWFRFPVKLHIRYLLLSITVIGLSSLSNLDLLTLLAERRDNWSHFIVATRQPLRMVWIFPLDVYLLLPLLAAATAWVVQPRADSSDIASTDTAELDNSEPYRFDIPLLVCVISLVLPVVAAWCLTELDIARLFLRRYLISSSVVLAVLMAIIMSSLIRGTRTRLLVSVLVLAWGIPNIWPQLRGRVAEDWRAAVPTINSLPAAEPLLFYSGLIEADGWWNTQDAARRDYCRFPLHALYPLDEARTVVLLPRTVAQVAQAVPTLEHESVWLLIRGSESTKTQVVQTVLRTLRSPWKQVQQTSFGRLTLIKLSTVAEPGLRQ